MPTLRQEENAIWTAAFCVGKLACESLIAFWPQDMGSLLLMVFLDRIAWGNVLDDKFGEHCEVARQASSLILLHVADLLGFRGLGFWAIPLCEVQLDVVSSG